MNAEELYKTLERSQGKKGYHLNPDRELTLSLLEGLLENKDRYGYMCCPCRLASGDRERDRDIICPCVYRDPDLAEYDQCYCALYVSPDWDPETMAGIFVPERRPPEKMIGL